MVDFSALAAEFPRDAVSWRAQTVSKNGDKGLALAYIDARDVMRRLDEVCTPGGWQDRYEVHGGKTICYLSIQVGDQWVTKADGSGDSDIEEEKGAISGAFKRAAAKWGIGRYLYDIEAPWVPCESYEASGKKRWSKWTADPWNFVRGQRPLPVRQLPPAGNPQDRSDAQGYIALSQSAMLSAENSAELDAWWKSEGPRRREFGVVNGTSEYDALVDAFKARKVQLDPARAAA
jgi:hypothetical protein